MDAMPAFVLGSIKAMVLLVIASGAALALHRRSARVRAVVWSIALAGCVAIPFVAPLMPVWSLPVPAGIARFAGQEDAASETAAVARIERSASNLYSKAETPAVTDGRSGNRPLSIPWSTVVLSAWALGALALLARLTFGLWRVSSALRRARPVTDPGWLDIFDRALERLSCRRQIRLLISSEIDIPATVGVFRPAIILPLRADTWLADRRQAVLLHEMVHVVRFDWPTRLIARCTRAAYWFNPLAWWAVRRLDLEQELACDEEVLALGTGASDYACHLLGIARHALPTPAPSIPALGMARTTHLEERIMTILKKTTPRRVGMAVLIPAAILMAAMVPALASVYPGDPAPRAANSEIKEILAEMNEVEKEMRPHLAQIEEIEIRMEPELEALENIEISIDDSQIAEIERQMEPYLEQLEDLEVNMQPFLEQIEEFEKQMEKMEFHIEDGNLGDIQRQIHEQIAASMEMIENLHVDMEPFHEQMATIHEQMEPLHQQLADIHIDLEPFHEQIENLHVDLEPFHEQMEQIHVELEPFHDRLEDLGDRLEEAIQHDVEAYLRSELGAVTSPGAPFGEAAARILDDSHLKIHDDELKIRGDEDEIREILNDLMLPFQIGTQENFNTAIDAAATGLSPMVIQAD